MNHPIEIKQPILICSRCARKRKAELNVVLWDRKRVPGKCSECGIPVMLHIYHPHNVTKKELINDGYSQWEAEEIIARIECGESFDSATQAVLC